MAGPADTAGAVCEVSFGFDCVTQYYGCPQLPHPVVETMARQVAVAGAQLRPSLVCPSAYIHCPTIGCPSVGCPTYEYWCRPSEFAPQCPVAGPVHVEPGQPVEGTAE